MKISVNYMLTAILWAALSLVIESKAQGFGELGTEWYYSGHNAAPPAYAGYYHFKSVQDTIIQNRVTHTLLERFYNFNGNLETETQHYFSHENDTLFFYSPGQARFQVFFVYNREKGDTLTLDFPDSLAGLQASYRLVIDTVFTETITGIPLKKYKTSRLDWATFVGPGYFMEKIGGTGWFFPTYAIGIPEGPGSIRCYTDAEIDTNFHAYPCDFRLETIVANPAAHSTLHIYPNPSSGKVFFKADKAIERVRLYDLAGQLLASTKEAQLDITTLINGSYMVKVQLEGGQEVWRKLVKW